MPAPIIVNDHVHVPARGEPDTLLGFLSHLLQAPADALAKERVIVDDEHANSWRHTIPFIQF